MKYVLLLFVAFQVQARAAEFIYFPQNYEDAARKFKSMYKYYPGSQYGSIPIESKQDKDLAVNYFYRPARNSENLLIITSGVHGAEAYAGSAVQQMFLEEILPDIDADKLGVLLIHSINPYGFKHFRRVDERNIDLNRNFSADPNLYSMENHGYDNLAEFLAPKEPVSAPFYQRLSQGLDIVSGIVFGTFSVKELSDAIGQGQSKYPEGLQYRGVNPAPQVDIITRLVERYGHPYKRVVLIDLHTGLGSANQLHMMTGEGVAYSKSPLLQKLLQTKVDGDNYDLATGDDPGFYPTPGDLINFVPTILKPDQEVVALTAEFGTIGTGTYNQLKTLNRLILENQGHHHGYSSLEMKRSIQIDFQELFFPFGVVWQTKVIRKSRYLFHHIVKRLDSLQ